MASTITIPSTSASDTLFSGISDVFSDLARSRENEYQRKRQEEADARAVIAAESVERNRQQLYDQRAALEAERLKNEAEFAAYAGSEQQGLDKLAAEGFTPRTGKYLGVRGAGPSDSINTLTTPTWRDKNEAELRLANKSRQEDLQNLNYIRRGSEIIQNQIIAAQKEGRQQEAFELTQKLDQLKYDEQVIKNRTQEQEQAWRGGFEATVPATQMVDAMVVPSQDWPEYKLFDPDLRPDKAAEYIGRGLPQGFINEKEKEEYLKHYGLAGTMAGTRGGWVQAVKDAGQTTTFNKRSTLAENFKDMFTSREEVTLQEAQIMQNNVLRAAQQIWADPTISLPPGISPLDVFNDIMNARNLYSKNTSVHGIDDNYAPSGDIHSIVEGYKKLNATERPPGDQEQATNISNSSNKTPEQREIDFQKMYRIYQEKMGGKLSYEAWRQTL